MRFAKKEGVKQSLLEDLFHMFAVEVQETLLERHTYFGLDSYLKGWGHWSEEERKMVTDAVDHVIECYDFSSSDEQREVLVETTVGILSFIDYPDLEWEYGLRPKKGVNR